MIDFGQGKTSQFNQIDDPTWYFLWFPHPILKSFLQRNHHKSIYNERREQEGQVH